MSDPNQENRNQDSPNYAQNAPQGDPSSQRKKMHPGTKLTMVALVLIFGLIAVGAWYGSIRPSVEAEPKIGQVDHDFGIRAAPDENDMMEFGTSQSSTDENGDNENGDEENNTDDITTLMDFWQVDGRVPNLSALMTGEGDTKVLPCGCIGTCKCALMEALLGHEVEVSSGLAGLPEDERLAAMKQGSCPVMGVKLGAVGTPIKVSYQGHDIYLCCEMCRDKFNQDPQHYVDIVDQIMADKKAKEKKAKENNDVDGNPNNEKVNRGEGDGSKLNKQSDV